MANPKTKRISFSNRYMFGRVMTDESLCAGVIEAVLGIRPSHIDYLNAEQAREVNPQSRGIRMDVYVESDGRVYDIEMQVQPEVALGRRFRYYQSAIDSGLLRRSQDYGELAESHIVFLCLADPFGASLPVYTIERSCKEDPRIDISCGAHWHVLNAGSWEAAPVGTLRNLLEYMHNGSVAEDPLIEGIDAAVNEANADSRWSDMVWSVSTIEENDRRRARMMEREAMERGLAKGIEQGIQQGIEQGEHRLERLVNALLDADRIDDLQRQVSDEAFRESLYEEFGI